MFHFTVGDYHCTSLNTGQFTINAETLFANASEVERAAAVEKYHLNADGIVFQVNPLVVDTGRNRVIIDPGSADKPERLIDALNVAEIDPASIDTVIISHGHADHFSGCITADGKPTFPNAQYVIQRTEWDSWVDPNKLEPHHAETFRNLLLPIQNCFTFLDGDTEIVPGIEVMNTPGHSAGHMVVLIGRKMIFVGDVILNPVHIEHPGWFAAFDVWPKTVVQTRQKLIRRIVQDNLWVSTYHFAAPGTGRIIADGDKYAWSAASVS